MADNPSAAELADRIEAQDASVVAAIAALTDRCKADNRNRTLFDVAIAANNAEVIALLAADQDALEFSAPMDAALVEPIKHTVAMMTVEVPISTLEKSLNEAFGEDLSFGRTPLHSACREGNAGAIETLIAAGAKTEAKDITDLSAAELAYFAHGEQGLRDFVGAFASCRRSGLPVGKRLLQAILPFPETLEQLLAVGKLDAAARRLLFCYRCARLDIDAVRALLADGYALNKGVSFELNPLWEACTSALLWDSRIPGGLEMAFHYTKYTGHPDASTVSFDNALLNEDGSNFDKLFREAERERKVKVQEVEKMTLSPDAEREVIARRIALLDALFDAGADLELARKKQEFATFAELKDMKLNAVSEHLKRRGGGVPKVKKKKPGSATSWELVGETGLNVEYWPDEGVGGLLRLVLHDAYGSVDGVTLSLRLSRGKLKPKGKWRSLEPVAETVEVEGEAVPRSGLAEPVYGESPWEATYEFSLKKGHGQNKLWIRLGHEDEPRLSGELEPWTFAKI